MKRGGRGPIINCKKAVNNQSPPTPKQSESSALKTKPRIHIIIPTEGEDSEGGVDGGRNILHSSFA